MMKSQIELQPVSIALQKAQSYQDADLSDKIGALLDCLNLGAIRGLKILVKPNLLMAKKLACTSAQVTASLCKWCLDMGARIIVADSPGFGSPEKIARDIGLTAELNALHLKVENLDKAKKIELKLPDKWSHKKINAPIARKALEADLIISAARLKAHSQMRMTLSVKNCFGCVPGLHKAFCHARHGADRSLFSACIAAVYAALPPVAGVIDGIIAMDRTGPSKGDSFPAGLLAASAFAPELDETVIKILGIDPGTVPLCAALKEMTSIEKNHVSPKIAYPLLEPAEFEIRNFRVPENLTTASFNPARLLKSCLKRIWKKYGP